MGWYSDSLGGFNCSMGAHTLGDRTQGVRTQGTVETTQAVHACCCVIDDVLKCQVGVLPLGTGNDLAQTLGWGASFDDDTQLSSVLDHLEHAQIQMLDRYNMQLHCV